MEPRPWRYQCAFRTTEGPAEGLANCSSQQRLQRGPGHPRRGRSERERLHLSLAVNVRTYNLTPGRELLFACRYRLGTASNFVVRMSKADNVYNPLHGSFVGEQGAWSAAKMYFAVTSGRTFRRRACPTRRQERWTSTASRNWRPARRWRSRQTRRRGRRRHAGHPGRGAWSPHSPLGWPWPPSQSKTFKLGYAMTLSAFAWNIVRLHPDAGETLLLRLPVSAGHGLQPGDVRQRGRQRLAARSRPPRRALSRSGPAMRCRSCECGAAGQNHAKSCHIKNRAKTG